MKKKSSLWGNLLLLFVVFVIGIIAVEFVLRFAWPGYQCNPKMESLMTYDDSLGWIGKTDYKGLLIEGGLAVPAEMNGWGFRDDEPITGAAAAGKRRLIFLGDSFMMGSGVEHQNRASEVVEQLEPTCISYNFGIHGYSTDQELLALQKYGPEVNPTDILLFFCANDLIYNDSNLGHRVAKSHFRVVDDKLILGNVPVPRQPEPNAVRLWFTKRTAIGQILDRALALSAYQRGAEERHTGGDLGIGETDRERANLDSLLLYSETSNISDLTYYLLRELRDEAQKSDANLIVFSTPSSVHWTAERDETPAEIKRVLNWCADLGIRSIDLFPYFYEDYQENNELLYLSDKMHWNDRGNRLAAEVIQEQILQTP
ncbi:SGNH/GDSL hydrolase family protein [bacterium]|nr:SGNH/GDSL hydrolase family protein [bacterium]